MSKQSLLLVDGDTRSLRVLEVSLRKAGFMVTAAQSVQDALDKLALHAPDLIISETTFPDGDGFELRRRVRATSEWSEIPFIFLTAEAAIENKIRGLELGVDDYLTKPIYIKEIVTRINILLQKRQRIRFEERRDGRTRFAGRVQDMPVVDVIQTIEISRKSGVIQFVGERGRQAAIYFRDGRVIDAEAGSLLGEDAVYRLLTWSEGEFEVVFRTVRRREVITMSSQALLMEGMRRLDEWSRLFEQLPPLTHRFEVDTVELAARLGDVPDDNNRILRLVDGKRTLLEVIEASDIGDLECLQAISRLHFEELLIDLDHGKAPRRDTGSKPVALVELDGPSPLSEETSGPARRAAATGDGNAEARAGGAAAREAGAAAAAQRAPAPEVGAAAARVEDGETPLAGPGAAELDADDAGDLPEDADEDAAPGPLSGGYRPSSLRLIDEAVAAAQAIEPTLFDDSRADEPLPPGHEHGSNGVSRTVTPDLASEDIPPGANGVNDEAAERAAMEAGANLRAAEREDSGLRMIGSLGRDRAEASGELASFGHSRPLRSETARELVTILPRRITRELPIVPHQLADSLPTPTPTASVLVARSVPALDLSAPAGQSQRIVLPGSGVTAASRSRKLLRSMRSADGSGPGLVAMLLIVLAVVLAGTAALLRLRRHGAPVPVTRPYELIHDGHPAEGTPGLAVTQPAPPDEATDAQRRGEMIGGAALVGGSTGALYPDGLATDTSAPGAPDAEHPAAGGTPHAPHGAEAGSTANSRSVVADASASGRSGGAGLGSTSRPEGTSGVAPSAANRPEATGGGSASRPGGDRNAEAKALCDAADNALAEGDSAKAFQLAGSALKLRRTARAYVLRARAEQRLGRVEDALSSLDAATEIAPTAGSVWEQRGRILWAARRHDEARAAFSRFLELSPNAATAPEVQRLINEPR